MKDMKKQNKAGEGKREERGLESEEGEVERMRGRKNEHTIEIDSSELVIAVIADEQRLIALIKVYTTRVVEERCFSICITFSPRSS